jgi:hypothetical protein
MALTRPTVESIANPGFSDALKGSAVPFKIAAQRICVVRWFLPGRTAKSRLHAYFSGIMLDRNVFKTAL